MLLAFTMNRKLWRSNSVASRSVLAREPAAIEKLKRQQMLRSVRWWMMLCTAALITILTMSTVKQLNSGRSKLEFPGLGAYRPLEKDEKTCIMFLKAHKCASTTVQNVLMRFGYARGLDFVLPSVGNYIGNPEPFRPSLIPPELTSPNRKYDIFTHHTRFNYSAITSVMRNGCKFVTILREPATLYESLFSFYKINEKANVTFENIVRSNVAWPKLNVRILKRIGLNQMAWDLGFDEPDNMDRFMAKIDKQFDLVMIAEHMEASLVLLADLMGWPLQNVISLKLNARPTQNARKLTEDDRDALNELNSIDAELYDYFLERFRQRLMKFGKRKLLNRVYKLMKMNAELQSSCVHKLNNRGYAKTTSYDVRNPLNWTCIYATKTELSFTDEIRNDQRTRFNTIKKLEMLMIDSEVEATHA